MGEEGAGRWKGIMYAGMLGDGVVGAALGLSRAVGIGMIGIEMSENCILLYSIVGTTTSPCLLSDTTTSRPLHVCVIWDSMSRGARRAARSKHISLKIHILPHLL
jgi:hypothetical protein